VLTDVNMPGMSGLELFRAARGKGDRADFIFITGFPDFRAAVSAIKEGAYDYVPKPFDLDDLKEKIDALFAERSREGDSKTPTAHLNKVRDGYSVVKSLGSGSSGVVLLVEKHDIYYAMKIMSRFCAGMDAISKKRFMKEAEILKSLDNENVVRIIDVGGYEPEVMPYIVMEYVHGAPLSRHIKNGTLSDEEKLSVAFQVASALEYIHSQNILHRDVKPENVLLTEDFRAKITDFGIAKVADPSSTSTDALRGSPYYMAPEILRGETEGDVKTDIFSLGVLIYELFTGQRPFSGKNLHLLMENIKTSKPPAPRSIRPDLPEWLEDALGKMLDKEPEFRLSSVTEVIKILKYYMSNPCDDKPVQTITSKILRSLLFRRNVWK
jgi:serine/threonine-protein kinase